MGANGEAAFHLNCPGGPPALPESYGFRLAELNRIEGALAEDRMATAREGFYAVSARYDRRRSRVAVVLNTGVELSFPTMLAEGLAGASPEHLADIEISPAGLGLHWPRLDADLYVPTLLPRVCRSKSWMARMLGAQGGRARTVAKVAASRENGRKGGSPRKAATA